MNALPSVLEGKIIVWKKVEQGNRDPEAEHIHSAN